MRREKIRQQRQNIRDYYAKMFGVAVAMPEAKKKELLEWEKVNLDDYSVGTSDWPGWSEYIGKTPTYPLLTSSDKELIPLEIRWQVWERDNFTCKHCGSRRDLTVDHIFPEFLGGSFELSNLQTLCRRCNSRKGIKVL